MNLHQKIVEVRKVAEVFEKDKKGFGYDYVSGNQILSKIKEKMNEMQLILQPSTEVGEHELFCYTNKKGEDKVDIFVWGKMKYTWINAEDPEDREEVDWAYYGQQDDISKSFGSGLTYSERYFLLKYFGLPTDEDDPDSRNTTGKKKVTKKSNKGLSEAQVKRLFAIAHSAGFEHKEVKKQIMKAFNKQQVEDLTRQEYDKVCAGYEKAKKE